MAMTKKEQAAVDAQIAELKLKVALHWTEPVLPDVPPPDSGSVGEQLTKAGIHMRITISSGLNLLFLRGFSQHRSTDTPNSQGTQRFIVPGCWRSKLPGTSWN